MYTSSFHQNPVFGEEQLPIVLPQPGPPPRNLVQIQNQHACAHASSDPFDASTSTLHEKNIPSEPTAAEKAHHQNRPLVLRDALDSAHASQGECTIYILNC